MFNVWIPGWWWCKRNNFACWKSARRGKTLWLLRTVKYIYFVSIEYTVAKYKALFRIKCNFEFCLQWKASQYVLRADALFRPIAELTSAISCNKWRLWLGLGRWVFSSSFVEQTTITAHNGINLRSCTSSFSLLPLEPIRPSANQLTKNRVREASSNFFWAKRGGWIKMEQASHWNRGSIMVLYGRNINTGMGMSPNQVLFGLSHACLLSHIRCPFPSICLIPSLYSFS